LERPPDEVVIPDHPEKATAICAAMLVLGAALLLFLPFVGAVLMVSGGIGLAISWEGPLGGRAPPITASSVTAGQPSPASSTDH
jgi:hypothetical protein